MKLNVLPILTKIIIISSPTCPVQKKERKISKTQINYNLENPLHFFPQNFRKLKYYLQTDIQKEMWENGNFEIRGF